MPKLARSNTANFGPGGTTGSEDMQMPPVVSPALSLSGSGGIGEKAGGGVQAASSEAIMVGMRLRPLIGHELGQEHCIKMAGNVVSIDGSITGGASQDFAFDFAMDSTNSDSPDYCGQAQCYEKMGSRMLSHMLNGYHTCLFCYGQTGTGKTTTIMGKKEPPSDQGLLLRLISDIYDEVSRQKAKGVTVVVKVQMLEVYNERLNDLLSDPQTRKKQKLDVRVHPEIGVYVLGGTTELCDSADDCLKLIDFGNTMKTVAATAMNSQSSRGHTVFKLILERRGGEDNQIITSEVYFADLAGRENEKTTQVTGDRLQELTFINRSLMWLANCINSLGGRDVGRRMTISGSPDAKPKRDMAKFRNSKLTLLLSNALSGNSRTAMIGTLSPAVANFEESFSTLKFAKTVKNIKLEAKAATAVDQEQLVAKLQKEILGLKKQLDEARVNSDDFGTQDLTDRLTVTMAIADVTSKSTADLRKDAELMDRLRSATLERLGMIRKSGSTQPPTLPYIGMYHDDPYLSFTVHHHIPSDGQERCIGYGDHVDLSLPAWIGVDERAGFIRNVDGRIFLRPAQVIRSTGMRTTSIEVNGTKLRDTTPIELNHLDCIVFGRSLTYYVFKGECQPEEVINRMNHQERMEETSTVMKAEELQMRLRQILGEDRAADKIQETLAKQYWGYQQTQHYDAEGRKAMHQWLEKARAARLLVEDANTISEVIRPSYYFELVAVAPVLSFGPGGSNLPELAVQLLCRVSQARGRWQGAAARVVNTQLHTLVKDVQWRRSINLDAAPAALAAPPAAPAPAPAPAQNSGAASRDHADAESFEGLTSSSSSTTGSPSPPAPRLMLPMAAGIPAYMSSARWGAGRNSLTSEDGTCRQEVVALWSYEKFRDRLEFMETVKAEYDKDPEGFVLTKEDDAWAEHGPTEISEMRNEAKAELREAKSQLADANAEIQKLRDLLASTLADASQANGSSGTSEDAMVSEELRDAKLQLGDASTDILRQRGVRFDLAHMTAMMSMSDCRSGATMDSSEGGLEVPLQPQLQPRKVWDGDAAKSPAGFEAPLQPEAQSRKVWDEYAMMSPAVSRSAYAQTSHILEASKGNAALVEELMRRIAGGS